MKQASVETMSGSFSDQLNVYCRLQHINPCIILNRKNKDASVQSSNFIEQLNEKNQQVVTQYRTNSPKHITTLRLPCCKQVNNKLFNAMCEMLSQSENIRSVHISQSSFLSGQFEKLMESLDNNECIESFEIFTSGITDEQCQALSILIEKQKQLLSLKLSDNKITDIGLRVICSSLRNSVIQGQKLRVLHIGGNPVTIQGICDALDDMIYLDTLQSLGLRSLGLTTPESLQPLQRLLQSDVVKLTDLQLRKNNLSKNIQVLSDGLEENTSLKVLELQDCGITENAMKVLADNLSRNPQCNLHALNISGNPLTAEATEAIAEILVSCHKLTTFTAESCKLESNFLQSLFHHIKEALKRREQNQHQNDENYDSSGVAQQIALTGLGLSNNLLDDSCAQILAPLLVSGQLTSLDVSRNKLTGNFLEPFATCNHSKSRLKHLDLTGNRLGPVGGNFVSQIVKKSPSLMRLFITDCCLPEKALTAVAESLRQNSVLQQMQYGGQSAGQNECGRSLRHQIDEKLRRNAQKAQNIINKQNISYNSTSVSRVQSTDSMRAFSSVMYGSEAPDEWSNDSVQRVQSMDTFDLMDMDGLAGASVFSRVSGMRKGIGSCGMLQAYDVPQNQQQNERSQSISQYVFEEERDMDDGLSSSDYDPHATYKDIMRGDHEQLKMSNQSASLLSPKEFHSNSLHLTNSQELKSNFQSIYTNQMNSFDIEKENVDENNKDSASKFQVQVQQKTKGRFQLSDNPH